MATRALVVHFLSYRQRICLAQDFLYKKPFKKLDHKQLAEFIHFSFLNTPSLWSPPITSCCSKDTSLT